MRMHKKHRNLLSVRQNNNRSYTSKILSNTLTGYKHSHSKVPNKTFLNFKMSDLVIISC